MVESKQTTIRFSDPLYRRLEEASERTGLPINSIVIVACMEWLKNEPDLERGHTIVYREGGKQLKEKLRDEKMLLHDEIKMQKLRAHEQEYEEARREKMHLRAELEELGRLQAEKKRLRGELEKLGQLQAEKKRQFAERSRTRFVMKEKGHQEELEAPEIEETDVEEPEIEEPEGL